MMPPNAQTIMKQIKNVSVGAKTYHPLLDPIMMTRRMYAMTHIVIRTCIVLNHFDA